MFNRAVNGGVQVNLDRDQRRSDGVEEEAHLIVAGNDDRRRPLLRSLCLHPRRQRLPPDGDVVAHARKHLVRNRHFQDRLQPIFPVEIRTQFPHLTGNHLVIWQTLIRLRNMVWVGWVFEVAIRQKWMKRDCHGCCSRMTRLSYFAVAGESWVVLSQGKVPLCFSHHFIRLVTFLSLHISTSL